MPSKPNLRPTGNRGQVSTPSVAGEGPGDRLRGPVFFFWTYLLRTSLSAARNSSVMRFDE